MGKVYSFEEYKNSKKIEPSLQDKLEFDKKCLYDDESDLQDIYAEMLGLTKEKPELKEM